MSHAGIALQPFPSREPADLHGVENYVLKVECADA
jgi:hypothetical protein